MREKLSHTIELFENITKNCLYNYRKTIANYRKVITMKKISVEDLLSWAFTQELGKVGVMADVGQGFSAAWMGMAEVASLGTIVDRSPNAFGVIPNFVYEGDPHPDAIIAGRAVHRLADHGFDIANGWNPMADWADEHGLIAEEVARLAEEQRGRSDRLSGQHVVSLVVSAAVLKRGPDWRADAPKAVMLMNKGKPAWFVKRTAKDSLGNAYEYEDNGFDQRRQRPKKGAYRKWRLDRSIRGDVLSRLDWQLWQSALEQIHAWLSFKNRLSTYELLPFFPRRQPWTISKNAPFSAQVIEEQR
ncbi:hypothetical protein [Ensifer sp. MJa1]|uniref:hypothetical protein n=1 Tax=Ensifer sp. MJa1 TaxID=2919888 RepID=UPI00300A7003